MPKKYSDEFKGDVICRYEQGESIKSLSQELHLAQSTIYRWTKEFCSIETSVRKYTPAEFDKLFRRSKKLEHELEIIHSTGLVTEIALQKKLDLLEGIYHEGKIVSMGFVSRWEWQGSHSIITYFDMRIAVTERRNRLSLC